MPKITPMLVFAAVVLIIIVAGFVYLVGWSKEMQGGIDFLIERGKEIRSVAVNPGGGTVDLRGMVVFRIPQNVASTQPNQDGYRTLNIWLTTELGGYTRIPTETQLRVADGSITPSTSTWMYFVGVETGEHRDVRKLVESKLDELFPGKEPRLIVSVSDAGQVPHLDVSAEIVDADKGKSVDQTTKQARSCFKLWTTPRLAGPRIRPGLFCRKGGCPFQFSPFQFPGSSQIELNALIGPPVARDDPNHITARSCGERADDGGFDVNAGLDRSPSYP